MWFLKRATLLGTLALTGCVTPAVVEMAVLPATTATAKIKQIAGKSQENPSSCSLPCAVTVAYDSSYEISFDAPGYYPATVQFDWLMAFNTASSMGLSKTNGNYRTPLVIPLVQRKVVKEKPVDDNPEKPSQ